MFRYVIMIAATLLTSLASTRPAIADCPGEPVPFAKLMYAEFAREYESCTVTTEVQFVASGQTANWLFAAIPPDAMAGRIALRVLSPHVVNPAAIVFGFVHPHVFADSSVVDLVSDLECGEMLTLTGHPVLGRIATPGAADFVQIIFVAETLTRSVQASDTGPADLAKTGGSGD